MYIEIQKLLHDKEALLDDGDLVPHTKKITGGIFVNNFRS